MTTRLSTPALIAVITAALLAPAASAQPLDPYADDQSTPTPTPTPAPTPVPAPEANVPPHMQEVHEAVARHLLERGKALFATGDHASAKTLFIESLERSPRGPHAGDALAMLRAANERLGISDLEHGNPSATPVDDGGDGLVDPYGDTPTNPYPAGPGGGPGGPADPYGGPVADPATDDGELDPRIARRRVTAWSAAYGAVAGVAIAGPEDEFGETRGVAVLGAVLGAGTAAVVSYLLLRNRELSPGQGNAIISGGTWGAYIVGLFGDTVTGVDSTNANEGFGAVAIGGALGTGAGVLLASKRDPDEDEVSVMNSFGLYGTTTGLMLGVVMQPPETEAYSINGMLGAAGGLGIGYYVAGRTDISRRRMLRIDLGAAAGLAATWALFYPLIADSGTNNDEQAAGVVSLGAMGVGAYLAYRWTRGMDDDEALLGPDDPAQAALPGLVTRAPDGHWGLGTPMLQPMQNPQLGPRSGGLDLGVNLLSGQF